MPELRFDIHTGEYIRNLVGQYRAMKYAALEAISQGAEMMIRRMQDYIRSTSPSGRIYWYRTSLGSAQKHFPLTTKPTKYGTHIASAPGDPPAELSGDLLNSLEYRAFLSRGHTRIVAEIYSNVAYAYYLEFGTIRTGFGGPIFPRPFMSVVLFDVSANVEMMHIVREYMEMAGHAYGAR